MSDKGDSKILDIEIADLKATAPHFGTHSHNLSKALTKLKSALGVCGSPWGDDEQGQKFQKHYGPHAQKMELATEVLALGLASICGAMTDMADGHIDNEELVRSMFGKTDSASLGSNGTKQ